MAQRNILTKEQPGLYKKSRPVTEFNPRLHQLLDDMIDTLCDPRTASALPRRRLACWRRAVIVLETNVPEDEDEYIIELINPEIIEASGEQEGAEGCLSVPGEFGLVKRPMHVKVRAQNRFGEWFEVEGDGLTARCFCHEIDHLEGIVFTSKAERMLTEEELQSGEY